MVERRGYSAVRLALRMVDCWAAMKDERMGMCWAQRWVGHWEPSSAVTMEARTAGMKVALMGRTRADCLAVPTAARSVAG